MSEELQQQQLPDNAPENNSPPEATTEDLAREQGWRPKEEYEGDQSKWVSAETFLAKGELIGKIETLGRELKNTKKAMAMLQDHHSKVKEAEFTRAVNFLKQQKKQAYESGDVDKIIEIDEQIANVKETQKQQSMLQNQAQQQSNEGPHPNFVRWTENNSWYNADVELREAADALGMSYAKVHPDKTPEDVLDYVAKKIKSAYPEKFTNQNRNRPSSVDGAGSSGSNSGRNKADGLDMSEEEIRVMNTFVRQGIMSKEEYIKELKSVKGIR